MLLNLISRYKKLIKYVKNWPIYFYHKWNGRPLITYFILRKHNIRISVPKATLRVFKEFFMSDPYEIDFLNLHLPKNSVVIDVGANIGMFPIRLLVDKPDITFYSFEPLPNNFSVLHHNISSNSFLSERIHIFQKAILGKKQDDLKIYFNKEQTYTDTSSLIPGFENNYDTLVTDCTTLEEICENNRIQNITLLKLDCEGSEYNILYESPIEIIKNIPFIVVETHDLDSDRNNLEGVKSYLSSLGFTLKTKPVSEKINLVWAWK